MRCLQNGRYSKSINEHIVNYDGNMRDNVYQNKGGRSSIQDRNTHRGTIEDDKSR